MTYPADGRSSKEGRDGRRRTAGLARRPVLAGGLGLAWLLAADAAVAAPTVEVWKQRACGCCKAWMRHVEAAGFPVTAHEVEDVAPIRAAAGVPQELAACHTAKIEGYIVEGHVPAEAIRRLLAERPAVRGIAVPGMPLGAPGMAVAGEPAEPYDVLAFGPGGSIRPFMSFGR